MKTQRNIFVAFILNLFFSVIEFIGGIITGSIAIISDAIHDFGDATSIGASFFLEKKSKRQPDETYTYGYARFSVLGGVITSLILLIGSGLVIYNAVMRIINPVTIDYNGMIILAIVGVIINSLATYFTHGGDSINQKAVNLHMLEDVLGWIVILIGAVVMRFTNFSLLDPILSVLVAVFILYNVIKGLKEIVDIFLIKKPKNIDVDEIKEHLLSIDGVVDVHHVHLWTIDGTNAYATLHVVCRQYSAHIKHHIKEELHEHGISHVTVEMELENEHCEEIECKVKHHSHSHCCHHHH